MDIGAKDRGYFAAPALRPGAWYHDGEDRTLIRPGSDLEPVVQQQRGAAHDGQTKAEALGPLPFGIAQLKEILEHRFEFFPGNADAGVPDLDPHLGTKAPAAQQQTTVMGVADGAGQQIVQHPKEQVRVAADMNPGRDQSSSRPLVAA